MKTLKYILALMLFVAIVPLNGFAQIRIVDDDYQPELGGLEEIKLEDLASEQEFDFAVGDTVYVLQSTHKFLCFNKKTQKASIKSFKPGLYVITGICFGDSINRLHNMVDLYTFDKEYDRQEAHAIVFGMRIKTWRDMKTICTKKNKFEQCLEWELSEGFPLCGDTVGRVFRESEKANRQFLSQKLVSFYQNENGKAFVNKMHEYLRPGVNQLTFVPGVSYKFENGDGDMYYIDEREIAFQNDKKLENNGKVEFGFVHYGYYSAYTIVVLKVSDYNKKRQDLVGKDFYFFDTEQWAYGEYEEMFKTKDYITQKEINIKCIYGDLLQAAKTDRLKERTNYESSLLGNNNYYYRCKDLFIRRGEFVVIFGNELGEFSLQLKERKNGDGFCNQSNPRSQYYSGIIDFVPKDIIDERVRDQKLSENERRIKAQKAEKERLENQKKHDAEIIAKYGEKYGNMILQHKVAIGMTKEMCMAAWWIPKDTFKTTTSRGESEVWVINYKTRLYFADGVLYMIDN